MAVKSVAIDSSSSTSTHEGVVLRSKFNPENMSISGSLSDRRRVKMQPPTKRRSSLFSGAEHFYRNWKVAMSLKNQSSPPSSKSPPVDLTATQKRMYDANLARQQQAAAEMISLKATINVTVTEHEVGADDEDEDEWKIETIAVTDVEV